MNTTAHALVIVASLLLAACSAPKRQAATAEPRRPYELPKELVASPEETAAKKAARTVRFGDVEIYSGYVRDGVLEGAIANRGEKPLRYVRVRVDYLDGAGQVIHSDWDFAVDSLPLQPGQERKWALLTRSPTGTKSMRVYPVL